MHQRDMERFAFLFLCGKRDRAILLGKEKMTFSDLDRLTYVSDFLGFKLYNLEIWNEYADQLLFSLFITTSIHFLSATIYTSHTLALLSQLHSRMPLNDSSPSDGRVHVPLHNPALLEAPVSVSS